MLSYEVSAQRVDAHGALAHAKQAELVLDTDVAGRSDAFNPAELLLAAVAACMIKGAERVLPLLKFDLRGMQVKLTADRQDTPPKLVSVRYEIIVETDEPDHRLDLLHKNIRKYGTISNTIAAGADLDGVIRRAGGANG